MTHITITITGLDPIVKALGELGAAKWLKALLNTSANAIKGRAGEYPRLTAPTYDRGWGPIYPSGRKSKTKTSQNMRGQWTVKSRDFSAEVENTATYAEFVIGQRQRSFHKARGWRSIVTESENEVANLEHQIEKKISQIVR